jgi:hypothetical protein
MWQPPRRRPRLELVRIDGDPSPAEAAALAEALERYVDTQRQAQTPSLWLRAGRGHGRRLGMYDYRDRFSSEDAWRLSPRFPPGGREYSALVGRGDAK